MTTTTITLRTVVHHPCPVHSISPHTVFLHKEKMHSHCAAFDHVVGCLLHVAAPFSFLFDVSALATIMSHTSLDFDDQESRLANVFH